MMSEISKHSVVIRRITALTVATIAMAACKSPFPSSAPTPAPAPAPVARPAPVANPVATRQTDPQSIAALEKEYRKVAARHIYTKHADKIFKGMMHPNLPAIGFVEVSLDSRGNVTKISWSRRPSDEDFIPVTERLIRAASPFPVAANLGAHVYSDTWLWDESGKFQLHTLTEGQR